MITALTTGVLSEPGQVADYSLVNNQAPPLRWR
jgi:hypothetical protein